MLAAPPMSSLTILRRTSCPNSVLCMVRIPSALLGSYATTLNDSAISSNTSGVSAAGVTVLVVIGFVCGVDSGIVARIRGDRESPLCQLLDCHLIDFNLTISASVCASSTSTLLRYLPSFVSIKRSACDNSFIANNPSSSNSNSSAVNIIVSFGLTL